MVQKPPKKPGAAATRGKPASPETPPGPSQAELLERTTEWLRIAGARVDQLTQELAARDERVAHLEQMLAEAEARRHDADLAFATATADLLQAGERILEFEAQLAEASPESTR